MNNNSTLFYEYTLTQRFEIKDIHDLSFDFEAYNDVFEKLDGFCPIVSDKIINKLIEFAEE
jgi:hypothetical protein